MFLADSMLVIFCKKGNLLAPQKGCEDKIGVGEVESKNTVIIRVALSNWKIKIMLGVAPNSNLEVLFYST
jgi:hypothetical protein